MPDNTEREIVEVHNSLRILFQKLGDTWTLLISCNSDDKRCENGFQLKVSLRYTPFECFIKHPSISSKEINSQVNNLEHEGDKYKIIFEANSDEAGRKSYFTFPLFSKIRSLHSA